MKISKEARVAVENWWVLFRQSKEDSDAQEDLGYAMQSLINSTLDRAAAIPASRVNDRNCRNIAAAILALKEDTQ